MPLDTMKQFQIIRKKLSKTKTELKSKSVGLKTTIDGIEKTRDKLDSKKSEIKKKIDAGKSHDLKLNILYLLLPQPYSCIMHVTYVIIVWSISGHSTVLNNNNTGGDISVSEIVSGKLNKQDVDVDLVNL